MKLNFVTDEELGEYNVADEIHYWGGLLKDNPFGVSLLYSCVEYVCLDRGQFFDLCKQLSTPNLPHTDNMFICVIAELIKFGLTSELRKFVYEVLEQANKFKTYKNKGTAIFSYKANSILSAMSNHINIDKEKLGKLMSIEKLSKLMPDVDD